MNISSVSASTLLEQLKKAASTNASTSSPVRASASEDFEPPPEISEGAQQMRQLSELASSDPEAFKATATEIAKNLREQAETATGKEAEMLNKMADDFEEASETGKMPGRQGPKGPPPGGPPPERADSAQNAQALASYEKSSSDPESGVFSTIQSIIANALANAD